MPDHDTRYEDARDFPPDWEPGDPVPVGFYVCDGNGEDGPCEPYLVPIEMEVCDTCSTNQRVTSHFTYNRHDPTSASRLACGHVNF